MDVIAYTDGACSGNPGPGGWAVVYKDPSLGTLRGNNRSTTNNRMELTAATKAVQSALAMRKTFPINSIEVCSDSAYVVNAVRCSWIAKWSANGWRTATGRPVKNSDLWRTFDQVLREAKKRGLDVKFTKVKGHAGERLNEMADQLAREGVKDAEHFNRYKAGRYDVV